LVFRISAGDQVAESELFRRYQRAISIILWKAGKDRLKRDDISDLAHDTFVITLEKIRKGEIREPEKLPGFIRSVALHLCAAHIREMVRYEQESDEILDRPEHGLNQYEELSKTEERLMIRQVLSQMKPERDRIVLFKFFIEEETRETICSNLGLSRSQFNVVLFRALERYKTLYKRTLARMTDKAANHRNSA
jgi:RNA polymerase sigma-70 factor (ECF subfamily)